MGSDNDLKTARMLRLLESVMHFGSYGSFAAMLGWVIYGSSIAQPMLDNPRNTFDHNSYPLFCIAQGIGIVLNILLLIAWKNLTSARRICLASMMILTNVVLIYYLLALVSPIVVTTA